jgi:hypothetical protein
VISHKIQNRVQSADAEKLMGGNRNALVYWNFGLQDNVASALSHFPVIPRTDIKPLQGLGRSGHEAFSSEGQYFVSDQVQANGSRFWSVEEVCLDGVLNHIF